MIVVLAGATFLSAGANSRGPVVPLSRPPSAEDGVMRNESTGLWFVQLSSAPTADGGTLSATQTDKKTFRSNAKQYGLKFTERYSYSTLWNGLST